MVEGIGTQLPRLSSVGGDTRGHAVRAYDSADTESSSTAHVSVSARAWLGAQVVTAAQASDGVDGSLVARLGAAVRDGTYQVSPDAIAAAMLGTARGRAL